MPPPASPSPSPAGGGLSLKKLPPWAWVVAIAGGAIVGFFLLKPGKPEVESAGEPEPEQGQPRAGSGTAGAIPAVSPDILGALGLTPGFFGPSFTSQANGNDGGSGDSGAGSEASTSPWWQHAADLVNAGPSQVAWYPGHPTVPTQAPSSVAWYPGHPSAPSPASSYQAPAPTPVSSSAPPRSGGAPGAA